jgi:hypothetical protein
MLKTMHNLSLMKPRPWKWPLRCVVWGLSILARLMAEPGLKAIARKLLPACHAPCGLTIFFSVAHTFCVLCCVPQVVW